MSTIRLTANSSYSQRGIRSARTKIGIDRIRPKEISPVENPWRSLCSFLTTMSNTVTVSLALTRQVIAHPQQMFLHRLSAIVQKGIGVLDCSSVVIKGIVVDPEPQFGKV